MDNQKPQITMAE